MVLATLETKSNGFLFKRVGRSGKLFKLYKIKTMIQVSGINTTITTINDKRITKIGSLSKNKSRRITDTVECINWGYESSRSTTRCF